MRKYNFFAKVHRTNPCRNIAKATQGHKTLPKCFNTLVKLKEKLDGNIHPEAMIHIQNFKNM